MGKIIIPRSGETEVKEGELVLLVSCTQLEFPSGNKNAATLGVYSEERSSEGYFLLQNILVLKKRSLGGIFIPVFENGKKEYSYKNPCLQVREIYTGQEKIVTELETWEGFKPHSEWIAKLSKPY